MKKYKNIKIGRLRKEDGCPFQSVTIAEHRLAVSDMYFISGENEPSIHLDGYFTAKTLQEVVEALKEFNKRARK